MRGIDKGFFFYTLMISLISVAGNSVATTASVEAGALELGLTGSFQSIEGSGTLTASVAVARYFGLGEQRVFVQGITEYSQVGELDTGEIAVAMGFLYRSSDSPVHPYVALRAGVQQEWLGSFSQARYPVGIGLGIKVLTSRSAAVNVAYEYRRMFADPVADYDEHRFVFGLSLLFRNEGTAK